MRHDEAWSRTVRTRRPDPVMAADALRIPNAMLDRAQAIMEVTDAACREHLDARRRVSMVAELDALTDELPVDAYDDEEQLSGFHAGPEEALRRGEPATIVGAGVEVGAVDCG